jgi:hypothetical protein
MESHVHNVKCNRDPRGSKTEMYSQWREFSPHRAWRPRSCDDRFGGGFRQNPRSARFSFAGSALPGFEAALRLIDDVDTAFAPHEAVVAVAAAQRFQGITDLHGKFPTWRGCLRTQCAIVNASASRLR